MLETVYGLLIPFLGTALGASCVLFMKNSLGEKVQRALAGFAAGVMVAASIWSLLIPSMEQAEAAGMGKWSFVPVAVGFWIGILFLLLLDKITPHLHPRSDMAEGPRSKLHKTTMMVLAVTLHNIPEGMAICAPVYTATGSRKRGILMSLYAGLFMPVGALIGFLVLRPILSDLTLGIISAVVAGIMVFTVD